MHFVLSCPLFLPAKPAPPLPQTAFGQALIKNYCPMIKRIFDLTLSLGAGLVLFPVMGGLWIAIRLTSPGPAVYWSKRVGRNNNVFLMPKFRTMRIDTPQVATHLLENPEQYVTAVGRILRKTSLDEVPQLWSILRGDMSFVGPRPALFNQDDLVALRTEAGVHKMTPGLTGWAQVNGRDELPIPVKVRYDAEYMHRQSLCFDLRILVLTFLKAIRSEGVTH